VPDSTRVDEKVYPRPEYPDVGWIAKATTALYEAYTGDGWYGETQSFRMLPEKYTRPINEWGGDIDWISPAAVFDDIFWPAISEIESFRSRELPGDKSRVRDDLVDFGWINAILGFNPAVYPPNIQLATSEWVRDRKTDRIYLTVHPRQLSFGVGFWEVWYQPAANDEAKSFKSYSRNKLVFRDTPNVDWIASILAVFDPALYAAIRQLPDSPQAVKELARFILPGYPDNPWLFKVNDSIYASFYPGLAQLLQTKQTGIRQYWTSIKTDDAWIFSAIPLFNSAFWPSIDQLVKVYRTLPRILKLPVDQQKLEWLNTLNLWEVPYFAGIDFQRHGFGTPKRRSRLVQDQDRFDWISAILGFNASLWPGIEQLIRVYRTTQRIQKFPVDQQKIDWIRALNLWEVPYFTGTASQTKSFLADKRSPEKHFLVQDQFGQGWIGFSVPAPYTPAMHGAIVELLNSFRGGKEYGKVSVLTDYPEFGWITVYVPVPPAVVSKLKHLLTMKVGY